MILVSLKKMFSGCLALTVALSAVGCQTTNVGGEGNEPEPQPTSDVATFITTADNTMHFDRVGKNFGEEFNDNLGTTVYLKPSITYQQIDGFGIALNGSACYNLMKMTPEAREKILKETFSVEEGMGYSYTRISIGCSDFSLSDYTCCDQKGIENFALTGEELNYVIPVLKQALTINPQLKIMGSPWTCPKWMKVNNLSEKGAYDSWIGGYLNPDHYEDYAIYFVKWIQAFEAAGIPIESVTIQNEPLNWGNSASLYMEWTQCRDFVKVLGPKMAEAGLSTKILVFDHNYNYDNKDSQKQYPCRIYEDATANQYIDGAAYHHYGGSPDEMTRIHNAYPQKNLYFTEGSIGTWNYQNYAQSFRDMAENVCFKTIQNWAKCAIMWNYMLQADPSIPGEGPYREHGCTPCSGAWRVGEAFAVRGRRRLDYCRGQTAKALRTGSTRIGTAGYNPSNVEILAADNPDGTYGIVFYNKNTQSVTLTVDDGNHYFTLTLPAESMTSAVWNKK